jgi:hypothetical protein
MIAMRGKVWAFNPHSGGKKITPDIQAKIRKRITEHAEKNYEGKFTRLDVKFRGALCYIDAYKEPYVPKGDPPEWMNETREEYIERLRNTPTHLCRIRHFDINRWSVAFYTYSNERYEPCIFPTGDWFGTPEEAFDIGAVYLVG